MSRPAREESPAAALAVFLFLLLGTLLGFDLLAWAVEGGL